MDSKMKGKGKKKTLLIVLFFVGLLVFDVVGYIGPDKIKTAVEAQKLALRIRGYQSQLRETVSDKVPAELLTVGKKQDIITKVEQCDYSSTMKELQRWYEWNNKICITVDVSNDLEKLPDDYLTYKYLELLSEAIEKKVEPVVAKYCPEYTQFRDKLPCNEYLYGMDRKSLYCNTNYEIHVICGGNNYQISPDREYAFLINGKEELVALYWDNYNLLNKTPAKLREEDPAQIGGNGKGNSRSTYYGFAGDPYDVDQYDDPEEFYEDHLDDFDEEGDAEDYYDDYQE